MIVICTKYFVVGNDDERRKLKRIALADEVETHRDVAIDTAQFLVRHQLGDE